MATPTAEWAPAAAGSLWHRLRPCSIVRLDSRTLGKTISILRLTVAFVALAGGSAAIACEYPPLVTIPEGREATREEMLEAQAQVRTYVMAMESYLACVGEELTVAGDDAPEIFKSIMFSRHNVAMAEMEAIANHYNEQLQIYRCITGTDTNTSEQSLEITDECAEMLTE